MQQSHLFVKSCTRILLPLAIIVATLLAFNGTLMTFEGKDIIVNMQGDSVQVSRGPVAAFVAIKHLGTNGGGFYGTNSAHPLENPNYMTNMVEMIAQLLIPLALKGVAYKPIGASALLRRNLLIYGLGGILIPFVGIKLIDLVVSIWI